MAACCCAFFFAAQSVAVLTSTPPPVHVEVEPEIIYAGGWRQMDVSGLRASDDRLLLDIPQDWKGKGKNQTRLLYLDYAAVAGHPYEPRNQGNAPSCVGQATAAAVDILSAVEIHYFDQPERAPPAPFAAGVIYGLSRQEIGGLGPWAGGGSFNLWAAQAVQKYGVVARLRYPMLGYDLRAPSADRCRTFGKEGIPDSLERIARLHPVKDYIAIDSYESLRDAMYVGGTPVIIGSNQGFGSGRLTRDGDGFLNPPFRVFFPSVWNHSMVCVGVCDRGDRPGALILNSWGKDWIKGPRRFNNEPAGSFWVDASIIDRMVKQGDSYALRGFKGYPDYKIWRPRK